ncbi:glycosyl transferase [Pedobacter psychrophilus]|uniref:Glycosyl transferase n=1 Tax=Pedobacter psychrophilus TaxID=1826909 RepID=A0A179DCT6_9SPHI|nr:glycosyltransferase family 2 protein [Pedobacter psychrophilus]OAQ38788.1 glycosyl transferase [Pedobacter psychrophilus]
MKISIITVVYNNQKTLETAIKSVLSQKYNDIEYIIIDGGSSDNTLKIIERYGSRISKIVSEPDKGIYDAMNKGISLATGDIIGVLNSDDIYNDNKVISDVMNCFINNPSVNIVYGDLVYVNSDDTNKVVRKWESLGFYNEYFEDGNVPPHPSLFLRAEVYQISGLFNLKYKLAADYEFMLRIFKKSNIESKYLKRLMVRMRLGGATNKSIMNIIDGNKEILLAWKDNNLKAPKLLMFNRLYKRLIQFIK